ncbi:MULTISPECIES: hypothetical protein [Enterococcus]|nr:hypothetical protein [Enterococcus avium]HAP3021202.1 hypothetical protein [Enterococcus faecalis]AYQ24221.1 hypothetical protein AUF16_06375 [Enterococcus avium]HAP3021898.1 hypothetical protein [Enterococcus faecalis]HBI1562031.1 hypothetical protein [Enterococcus faecalis]HBI1563199.1 hypothetical protein [Enterococcus faecalis]
MAYEDVAFLENLEKQYNIVLDQSYSNLVHFQTTSEIPFQRWYSYREGYSYKLVQKFITKYNISGALLDPFMGSGSSILAGRFSNLKTYGIDVNPISLFVSKVENRNYFNEDIKSIQKELVLFQKLKRDSTSRTTNFELATKYFNEDILQTLLQLREHIESIDNSSTRDVFFLSWLSIVESISNVKKEGNGLKYRNRRRIKNGYINIPIQQWEEEHFPKDKFNYVLNKIINNINNVVDDLQSNTISAPEPVMLLGSSMEKVLDIPDQLELTIFSPPYVNFFDYFEIHKTELWLGGFIKSQEELKQLKRTGLRSNASATVSKLLVNTNASVSHLTSILETKKLWSNKIPVVIAGYFDDMETLIHNLYVKTQDNGRVAIVIGNSAYAGIIIPSDLLIAEIGEKIGFKVEEIIVTRHLTTSSQQRKYLKDVMDFMRESIVILRKE